MLNSVHSVKWTVWSGPCEVDSVKWTVWSGQCEVDSVRWTVCGGQCEVDSVWSGQCEVDSVKWTVWSWQCEVDSVWSVLCPFRGAVQCPVKNEKFAYSTVTVISMSAIRFNHLPTYSLVFDLSKNWTGQDLLIADPQQASSINWSTQNVTYEMWHLVPDTWHLTRVA